MLALGAFVGTINGLVTTRLQIQSFIATLAMLGVARGVASLWAGGYAIPLAFGEGADLAPPRFKSMFAGRARHARPGRAGSGVLLPRRRCSSPRFALRRTGFGRHVYAVGGNATAARLSGVNVNRVQADRCSCVSGLLAGLAALLHAALVNQGSHIDGNGYELNAIAAVVIGGTSLAGGVGTVVGSMIGALTLSVLDNILGLRNIESEYQAILKGVIIVLAVVLQRQTNRDAATPQVAPNAIDQLDQPSTTNNKEKQAMRTDHREHGSWRSPPGRAGARRGRRGRRRAPATTAPRPADRRRRQRGTGAAPASPRAASRPKDSYLIGMSQANKGEPWRQAMNDQIAAAAEAHPSWRSSSPTPPRTTPQQVADVENFLAQGIDLLIISPNEAAPLTDVVAEACAKGVPVIVLDRKVEGDQFTMWIGADNVRDRPAGRRATPPSYCTDQGADPCNVMEIRGLEGSTPGAGAR